MDVETTGLFPGSCRVLSLAAVTVDEYGRRERQLHTLLDPGCDPGPVHIHGLTRDRLAGSPRFADVLPELREVLADRVLVAHNAAFDYNFLAAEAVRAGGSLPTKQRMCTLALSRRLGVDVPNHQLGTLAAYWRVPQQRAHDALDDVQVLTGVLGHSLALAARLDMPLPLVACGSYTGIGPFPSRQVKTPCPWRCPGRWTPGAPLVQGMKVVFTGETRLPREELADRCTRAGLEVLNSVSRLTSVLVTNERWSDSRKFERAQVEETPVLDEATLVRLLADVRPGQGKEQPAVARVRTVPVPAQPVPPPSVPGPMARRRVLVVGGTHQEAAAVRAEVVARGGSAAVNYSAKVTDLVVLAGGSSDPRIARAQGAGVAIHTDPAGLGIELPGATSAGLTQRTSEDLAAVVVADGHGEPQPAAEVAPVLPRGGVLDLPAGAVWTVNAAWRADALTSGAEVDVVAFLLDDEQRTTADEDFVFYNAPVSEDGAVALSLDGDSEQSIRLDLSLLPDYCSRVVVAAALSSGTTFGELGAIELSVDGEQSTAATATLDAGTTETTMLLAEIYLRNDRWRVRVVGQGYDTGLTELCERYGVDVTSG